jgi:hypothetical protein
VKKTREASREQDNAKEKSYLFHFVMRYRHHMNTEIVPPTYNSATHIWWHIIYDLVETDMITEEMAWNSLFREKMYNIGIVLIRSH